MRKLFFLDVTRCVAVFGLGAAVVFIGCSSERTENVNVSTNAANTVQSVPAAESGALSATPTPELSADGLPKIAKGDKYSSVRESMIKAGWKPARSSDGDDNCVAGGRYCKEFPELEAGPSSGAAHAIFRWERSGKIAQIYTIGEDFSFVNVEISDKPKPDPGKPLTGSFTYKYTEDYGGRISFTFDGKGGADYTWEQEDVTWNGKGTYEWRSREQAYVVVVNVAPEGEPKGETRADTFVLVHEGKNLKLIQAPVGMDPYQNKIFLSVK